MPHPTSSQARQACRNCARSCAVEDRYCSECGSALRADIPAQPDAPIRDSELRLILEHIADLIAVIDKHGKRLYNSPSYRAVLGDPSQLRGTDSFGEVHPDDRARLRRTFEDTLQSGIGRRAEYRFVRPDGTIRYVESQSDVVPDPDGHPDKVVVVSRDITERKHAEEALKTTYSNLQAMQAELVQSEKLASIGQFTAGIVHDLKNPLGVVKTGVELLRNIQQAGQPLDDSACEALELVEESATHAINMVHGLLDLARRDDLTLAREDLHPVVETAVAAVRHAGVPPGIQLTTALEAQLSSVMLDPGQMQQVLINLITNAIHAMPHGGTVRVSTATAPVPEGFTRGGRRVALFKPGERMMVVEVADTGTGIPQENLAKIWEPFFTTKPRDEGAGLGLAIVRSMVERHHGFIDVSSTIGKGTTFSITLPLAPAG